MLDRYMESKAPFHKINKSSEWKDYIIWKSYKEIINNNNEQYIFISNNIEDFSNNKSYVNTDKGNYRGHDDFYKDISINNENLKFYRKINGFLEENKEYQKIYTEYLINKYNSNEDISIIEKLLFFTAKFIDKYDYKNNEIYIRKITITDRKKIININKNKVNIKILIEYKDITSIATRGNGKKDKKEKVENIVEEIETKCTFAINIQNLTFSIDSIKDFEKIKIKTTNRDIN